MAEWRRLGLKSPRGGLERKSKKRDVFPAFRSRADASHLRRDARRHWRTGRSSGRVEEWVRVSLPWLDPSSGVANPSRYDRSLSFFFFPSEIGFLSSFLFFAITSLFPHQHPPPECVDPASRSVPSAPSTRHRSFWIRLADDVPSSRPYINFPLPPPRHLADRQPIPAPSLAWRPVESSPRCSHHHSF